MSDTKKTIKGIIDWNDPNFKLNPKFKEDIEKLIKNENIKKAFLEYCAERKKQEQEIIDGEINDTQHRPVLTYSDIQLTDEQVAAINRLAPRPEELTIIDSL